LSMLDDLSCLIAAIMPTLLAAIAS
jgi:hypothetical protein